MVVYSGKSVFGGIAIGKISVYAKEDSQVKCEKIDDPEAEIERYHKAKDVAIEQLGVLYEKALKEVGEDGAGVFEAHQMMVEDGDYIDENDDYDPEDEGESADSYDYQDEEEEDAGDEVFPGGDE